MNVALGASNTRPAFKMSRNSVSGAAISGVVPYDVIDINQGGFTLNAAAGTAIAPVTGIYHFSANVAFGNPTSSSGTIYFDVGGVQYQQYLINPTVVVNSSSRVTLELNGLIAMTAGDTIKIQYQVGSGTVTIDGIGAGELTSFQGYLIG
jgi:hypothetical protein